MSLGLPHMSRWLVCSELDPLADDDIVIAVVAAPAFEVTVWRPRIFGEAVIDRNAVEHWLRRVLDKRLGLPVIEPSTGDEVYLVIERIAGVRVAEARHLGVAVRQLETYTRSGRDEADEASFAGLLDGQCEGGET